MSGKTDEDQNAEGTPLGKGKEDSGTGQETQRVLGGGEIRGGAGKKMWTRGGKGVVT